MLLYLNATTFCDGGETAKLVCAAMDAGVTMVLVQELDEACGACAFRRFFEARRLLYIKIHAQFTVHTASDESRNR